MTGCGGCGGSVSAAGVRRCLRHRKNASSPMIAMAKNAAMPIPASAPVDRPDEEEEDATGGDAGALGVDGGNVNGVGPGVMDGVVDGVVDGVEAVVDIVGREMLVCVVLMPPSPVPVAVAVKDVIPVV